MEDQIFRKHYKFRLGEIILGSYQNSLVLLDWKYRKARVSIDSRIQNYLNSVLVEGESAVINLAIQQMEEYLSKQRTEFSISLKFTGTEFQNTVWKELQKLEFGKTISYNQLAKNLGSEKLIRAAANANGANPISIIVPCHRVIGSDGSLVGYAGGISAKKKLLELESSPDLFSV